MSIRYFGRAMRSFIIGPKLWPPASNLASSPCWLNSAIASDTPLGFKYSNATGYIFLHRLLGVFVSHLIPFARADFFVCFLHETEIVDLIERDRRFDSV